MRGLLTLLNASWGFLAAFFQAKPKRQGLSTNGHVILEGWDDCPEEQVIAIPEVPAKVARVGLFAYQGPHCGELFLLSGSGGRIGRDLEADLVLTPVSGDDADASYRLLINGHCTLTAETSLPFLLNGKPESRAEIFDYDEIEMLGNRFLIFSMPDEIRVSPVMERGAVR